MTSPLHRAGPWLGVAACLAALAAPSATYADFRLQAFPPALRADDSVAGPAADPDRDGRVNFAEHALGTDPLVADTRPVWKADTARRELTFAVSQASAARDAALRFRVTDGLGVPGTAAALATNDASVAWTTLAAALPVEPARPARFAQLDAEAVPPPPATTGWVWFEAEPPNGEAGADLSGGQMTWVGPGGSVQKTVTVPADGTYSLWVRKFWNPQGFRWRAGAGAAWNESREQSLGDLVMLGGNAGRRVGWANVGSVTLRAGAHAFRLEPIAGDANTTAYDCFVLTRDPFTPRGRLKPGEAVSINEPGWFAFQPQSDEFSFSPVDLRRLNEAEAGEQGFIRAAGEDFLHEKTGLPARFWAVNVGLGVAAASPQEVQTFARAMAKRGVNLVRIHGPVYDGSGPTMGRLDTNRVAQVQHLVHALKREGIYTALSLYFPLWVQLGPENTDFPGYSGGKHPFALLYFNPAFESLYRTWWRGLLTAPNPHGPPLKDEPAVAFAEMVNEDSTLFWTFNPDAGQGGNIPDAQRALLEGQFGDWLLMRYPGLTLAQIKSQKWANLGVGHDNFAAGRAGFRPLWNLFNERRPRDRDTAEFLTELMTRFHRRTFSYFKDELGFRGLVTCSNWKTASPQYLDPLDKLANDVGDFFDRHGYFGGLHEGPNSAWNIEAGQSFDDLSALKFRGPAGSGDDFANPIFDLIYSGKPSVISEINWPEPNRFRADMALVGAAYAALQGTDAVMWFAAGAGTWDGLPGKFSIQTPGVLGQFPAAALIYRQGLVRTAPRVVDLDLNIADLQALKGTPLPAPQNFDQLRGGDVPPGGVITNVGAVDSLAFLVGRVGADFVTNAPASRVTDLSPWLDRTNRVARSHTGELAWHWGAGRLEINAPAAQGVAGFLGAAGRIELADVVIESPLEYGAIVVVALDGKPISESAKLLVQVAGEERPHQWATDRPAGKRSITNRGTLPLMVRHYAGQVAWKRPDAAGLTATPLDHNGYRRPGNPLPAAPLALAPEVGSYLVER
ncbi:MAG: hypothetical protein ACKVYV_18000 [Limisphaerales bacterium]